MKKILFTIFVSFIATACASKWDVQALKDMQVNGSSFDKALKNEYVKLAEIEKAENDWNDVEYFIERGKMAAVGNTPRPEYANYRKVPLKYDERVRQARSYIVRAIHHGANALMPDQLAKAQTSYECWTQELEEGFQPKDIRECWKKFEKSLIKIGEPLKTVLFFESGMTKPLAKEAKKIKTIAKLFKKHNFDSLYVAGHSDSFGSKAANQNISEQRAKSIVSLLKKYGVSKNKIRYNGYGDGSPAVCAKKGTPSARNRRVEVYFE
jgi:outer membrane protein OmpA-like peptidoglycan-associated protein